MHNQAREAQPYEDCQAKLIQEFEWTSQGMDWRWVKASRATTHRRVEEFGYSCRQRRLTWAKEEKNWTVAQWSKVLFSDESKFCILFGNQVPRVWRKGGEDHSPSFLKFCVKIPQSVMIWGAIIICWIYIALFWVLKALYIEWGNLLNHHQCAASTWMMRRQPYCARTPSTHQLIRRQSDEANRFMGIIRRPWWSEANGEIWPECRTYTPTLFRRTSWDF